MIKTYKYTFPHPKDMINIDLYSDEDLSNARCKYVIVANLLLDSLYVLNGEDRVEIL